jgi:hypothetical protein
MSRESLEVVRAMYDAFNRGDTDAIVELADPAVSVRGEGPLSRIPLEGRFTHVWQIAGGMVRRLRVYPSKQEALEALEPHSR